MRTGLSMFLCWALLVFPSASLKADAVGDIDNDGKAGLPVGITNLVLTAGLETAVPDIPLRPVFRGYEESAFVNFLEQSHDGTGGWPLCGRQPAAG